MPEHTVDSFEDFVQIIFDPSLEGVVGTPWYEAVDIPLDEETCASYYIQLFSSPEFLLERFSPEQLGHGFAAMLDCNFPLSVSELVWDERLALELRERLIGSMVPLFSRLFDRVSFAYATHMWWDILACDHSCGQEYRGGSEGETRLQEAMFAALRAILKLQNDDCLRAALHGLGHLRHPGTGEVIRAFLESNPALSLEMRRYALDASIGDVQ